MRSFNPPYPSKTPETDDQGAFRSVAERDHGRTYLLDQLLSSSSATKRRNRAAQPRSGVGGCLALGYEVLEVRDDGDEGLSPLRL